MQPDLAERGGLLEMTGGRERRRLHGRAGREGTYEEIYAGHIARATPLTTSSRARAENGRAARGLGESSSRVGFHPFSKPSTSPRRPRPDSNLRHRQRPTSEAVRKCYFDKYDIEAVSIAESARACPSPPSAATSRPG